MKHELTGKRPSRLSPIFRHHSLGRLEDWTRHVDCDWRWYCPHCSRIVILIEEKSEDAAEHSWSVTRRAATHHEDRPWAWKVVTHADGNFTVTAARLSDDGHQSIGPSVLDEDTLVSWIERAFVRHYETQHPEKLVGQAA